MASQLAPGEMTKNSRMPYLSEQTWEINLNTPEHSLVISPYPFLSVLIRIFFFFFYLLHVPAAVRQLNILSGIKARVGNLEIPARVN